MVAINSEKLYEYLKEQANVVKTLSNKDIVLSVFAAQHLQGHHEFHSGTGAAATIAGLIVSLFPINPALTAVTIVTGGLGAVTAIYNMHKSKKIAQFNDIFTEEITKRYPDIITAYIEISAMIQNMEREDILDYFKKAGAMK